MGIERPGLQFPAVVAIMSRHYNMYNVQAAEMWKQRVARENNYNSPIPDDCTSIADSDERSSISGTNISGYKPNSNLSVASSRTMRKINELEAQLESERRKREDVESQLKALQK